MPEQQQLPDEYTEFVEIDGEASNISDLQNEVDAQLRTIFQEFGGDPNDTEFKIFVYRTIPNRAEMEFCFSCFPADLPITEKTREEFGAGAYEIRVYKDGKIFKKRKMNIAKPLPKPVHSPAPSSNDTNSLLSTLMENQRQQFEQLQQVMVQQTNQPNQMDQMSTMLNMMAMMKQVMGEPAKAQDPMKIIDLAKTLAETMGDGGDKSSFDRLIETALPALLEGAKEAAPQMGTTMHPGMMPGQIPVQPQGFPPRQQNPAPRPQTVTAPVQSSQNRDPQAMFKMIVKKQLEKLNALATADKDPGLYAEVTLDQVPAMYMDKYLSFINNPTYFDELVNMMPEVTPNKTWFDEFREATLLMQKEAEEEENQSQDLTNGETLSQTSDHVSGESTVIESEPVTDKDNGNPSADT